MHLPDEVQSGHGRELASFYLTLTADTYVLVEATITTFSFVRLSKDRMKEVIIAIHTS